MFTLTSSLPNVSGDAGSFLLRLSKALKGHRCPEEWPQSLKEGDNVKEKTNRWTLPPLPILAWMSALSQETECVNLLWPITPFSFTWLPISLSQSQSRWEDRAASESSECSAPGGWAVEWGQPHSGWRRRFCRQCCLYHEAAGPAVLARPRLVGLSLFFGPVCEQLKHSFEGIDDTVFS